MAKRSTQQEQRFRLLDILLMWEGELSNKRLRELLDIPVVRASRMLSEYRDAHPERVNWHLKTKRYLRVPTRERYGESADDYLRLLYDRQVVPDWLERLDSQISSIRPEILSTLRHAIELRTPLDIMYVSMSHPEGTRRVILPHGLAKGGRRWHVRAWCGLRQEYRDFVVGRIRSVESAHSEFIQPHHPDVAWEAQVDVRLVAHHELDAQQAKIVRDELFEGMMARRIRTRGCLVPYLIQEVRASVMEAQKPPEYQIEVSNLVEIQDFLWM